MVIYIGSLYKKIMVVFGQKHTTEANFEKCSSHYSFSTLGAVFFMPQFFTIMYHQNITKSLA